MNIQSLNASKSIWDGLVIPKSPAAEPGPQDSFQKSEPVPDFMAMLNRRLGVVRSSSGTAEAAPVVIQPSQQERDEQKARDEQTERQALEEEQQRRDDARRQEQAAIAQGQRREERYELERQISRQENEVSRLQQQTRDTDSWANLRPDSGWAQDSWPQENLRAAEAALSDLRSRLSQY